mmetsp:Transcript_39164/g.83857  ORF Transcript_39164/g.83857 Transcript_39164/m.83857 type:complete len:267 (+) Transcript_39164:1036-1836(+)
MRSVTAKRFFRLSSSDSSSASSSSTLTGCIRSRSNTESCKDCSISISLARVMPLDTLKFFSINPSSVSLQSVTRIAHKSSSETLSALITKWSGWPHLSMTSIFLIRSSSMASRPLEGAVPWRKKFRVSFMTFPMDPSLVRFIAVEMCSWCAASLRFFAAICSVTSSSKSGALYSCESENSLSISAAFPAGLTIRAASSLFLARPVSISSSSRVRGSSSVPETIRFCRSMNFCSSSSSPYRLSWLAARHRSAARGGSPTAFRQSRKV